MGSSPGNLGDDGGVTEDDGDERLLALTTLDAQTSAPATTRTVRQPSTETNRGSPRGGRGCWRQLRGGAAARGGPT
jgi:hypothetical protein